MEKNGGEMNYIMRRTSKSNTAGLKSEIQKNEQKILNNFKKTYQDGYNEATKKGLEGTAKKRYAR